MQRSLRRPTVPAYTSVFSLLQCVKLSWNIVDDCGLHVYYLPSMPTINMSVYVHGSQIHATTGTVTQARWSAAAGTAGHVRGELVICSQAPQDSPHKHKGGKDPEIAGKSGTRRVIKRFQRRGLGSVFAAAAVQSTVREQ